MVALAQELAPGLRVVLAHTEFHAPCGNVLRANDEIGVRPPDLRAPPLPVNFGEPRQLRIEVAAQSKQPCLLHGVDSAYVRVGGALAQQPHFFGEPLRLFEVAFPRGPKHAQGNGPPAIRGVIEILSDAFTGAHGAKCIVEPSKLEVVHDRSQVAAKRFDRVAKLLGKHGVLTIEDDTLFEVTQVDHRRTTAAKRV